MRTPNLGSVQYVPGIVPEDQEQFRRFIETEFANIAASIRRLADGQISETTVAPTKPRKGNIRFADGTSWNPGYGKGLYLHDGSAWRVVGALDKGTFTPTLVSSGGGTPTYTTQIGNYSKIGNRVFFQLRVQLATAGTLAAGNLTIAGLPFATEGTTGNVPVFSVNGRTMAATAATALCADATTGSTSVRLFRFAAGALTALAFADITGTSVIDVSGSYMI